MPEKKGKTRNYSFKHSKRLPPAKMTELNGIRIPSMPGSCYHAIICALAETKDQFLPWNRIVERTEKYIRQYGGPKAWERFRGKEDVKSFEQRIKDNTHTLTRMGRDCYGYRLHEQGMCIYFFKDGAMLVTGGQLKKKSGSYEVVFSDGRTNQIRYRGTTMTNKEYKRFLELGFVTASGKILDAEGIRKFRADLNKKAVEAQRVPSEKETGDLMPVAITLEDTADQETAVRLEALGVIVNEAQDNALLGLVPPDKLDDLLLDKDVRDVEIVEA